FGTEVLLAPRSDRVVNVVARDVNDQMSTFSIDNIQFDHDHTWSNYVRGVIDVLQKVKGPVGGMDLLVSGNVPQGAGLSSSASFEIALLKVINDAFDIGLTGVEAAIIGQRAENEFVGCSCGIMDQLISALGRRSQAMLLDCQSLEFQYTPLSDDYQIVIIDSKVKRGLVDSEYNLRRKQCENSAKIMGLKSLRDGHMDLLASSKSNLSEHEYLRARHVITENERTQKMFLALQQQDYSKVSHLMRESHYSMRDDFHITVPAIDYLVEIIEEVLQENGGVRMTGGGFGGCVVALCPKNMVNDVMDTVNKKYNKRTGIREAIYLCSSEDGAFS
ncbi:MAG: galactokinase, partial [Chitinophagaceae bacterium]